MTHESTLSQRIPAFRVEILRIRVMAPTAIALVACPATTAKKYLVVDDEVEEPKRGIQYYAHNDKQRACSGFTIEGACF